MKLGNTNLRNFVSLILATFFLVAAGTSSADQGLLDTHCSKCHNDEKTKGDFNLAMLGTGPNADNGKLWIKSLENLEGWDMPPEVDSELSEPDRERLIQFLKEKISASHGIDGGARDLPPRRMNNRELANSVADVLLIEDVGTHRPTADLVGDALRHGFDTDGDALGISQFQLEQYIEAFRKIVDATIFSGPRPPVQRYEIKPTNITEATTSQQKAKQKVAQAKREDPDRTYLDFLSPKAHFCFSNFETTPATGRYRIKVRATGIDRGLYDPADTGVYNEDPIALAIHLGDRIQTFELPDDEVMEIELDEWIAAGTKLKFSYPTDGLRMRGNGNFKFQYNIAATYIKENDPARYAEIVNAAGPGARATFRDKKYWQGARPRLFSAEVEGPIYENWPPKRQVTLLGKKPKAANAASILLPIAQRAWRRNVQKSELDPIVQLVKANADELGDIEALKVGIVTVLASPSFILINPAETTPADRLATKMSYLLRSTTPGSRLQEKAHSGEFNTFEGIRKEVESQIARGDADEFLQVFPYQWLQLDRINFMAPDPIEYRFYEKKRVSEDMIAEVRMFFRHAIENNISIPEMLATNYSFINADLATIYGIEGVPQDSKLRKHTFADGRRGGFMGMGAFLTLTADTLTTSPIHRAVYVMENFLGIHPVPPPPNVVITEPDVRQAKTIKDILTKHQSDENCASCHRSIDPYGYAFENFDPSGAWRETYVIPNTTEISQATEAKVGGSKKERALKDEIVPIDPSSKFRSGAKYDDIVEFRKILQSKSNRKRFVRCFITKLLTYANGVEPYDVVEIDNILAKSAQNNFRIVDTIAAVIDSPLFREE